MDTFGTVHAPYLSYVRRLCQSAALAPDRLVEILREIDREDVDAYRTRMLKAARPRPDQAAGYITRAYIAGICEVDDLDPDLLARQVENLMKAGLMGSSPMAAPTTTQLDQMLDRIEEHALLVQACRPGHRRA